MTDQKNPLLKYQGRFSIIESRLRQYPIIGFDSEDDSKGTPLLFGFYGDFKKKFYHTKFWEDALEFIYELKEPTILVAHNLEYDIANLFKASDYMMVEEMLYASKLLKVTLYGTDHYFLNSHCWFTGALKKMGAFIGLPKMEGDALSVPYLKRDCEIVYQFTRMFQKKLQKEAGVNLGVTVGKMAMDTYRRHYMADKKQITYNSPNCLKAYYGGRVEIFYKGHIKDVRVADINSCYPFVMKTKPFPDTSSIEPSSIHTHEYGIGKFTVRVPADVFIPVLPFKSGGGKLFFPIGEFTGWWTYHEMRYAVIWGTEIITEHEGEGTNTGCYPFTDFIDTFYDKRIACSKRLKKNPGDTQAEFDKLYYKLFMNNLYGKWCQNKSGNMMTRDKWPAYKLDKLRENPAFKESKIGPFYNYYVPKEKPPITANFMWGIYVTSYSRIYLHQGLMDIKRADGTLLYCDTDSVMYSPGPVHSADNFESPFRISSALGDWDEERFDLGVFRQSKGYLLCDREGDEYEIVKCACKGVPTHLAHDFIIDGMAKTTRPLRMKEALIRMNAEANIGNDELLDEIGENVWFDVQKQMKSVYVKRAGHRGVTRPVDAATIPHLDEISKESEQLSIRSELEKNKIRIKKPGYKRLFENTVIPARYFDGRREKKGRPELYISQKVFYLLSEQCLELRAGDIWFAGDCLQLRKNKNGKRYYYFYVTHFKGRKTPLNFWGGIWVTFFNNYGLSESLLNKHLEIRLKNNYIENGSLDLGIKISAQKNKGHFEQENLEDQDELSETEIEKLMSQDWSKIKCPN